MALAYLKYYFAYDGQKLTLDSVECLGDKIGKTKNFLKWYEEGDIEFEVPPKEHWIDAKMPLVAMMSFPQKITFDLQEAIRKMETNE